MSSWHDDLLDSFGRAATPDQILGAVQRSAACLGFNYCSYGVRQQFSLTSTKTVILNNYPQEWQRRYEERKYLERDPTVKHGCASTRPLVWCDALFRDEKGLWEEARANGLRFGWAQSNFSGRSSCGMLTLCRSHDEITEKELAANELKMRWLGSIAHLQLSAVIAPAATAKHHCDSLTAREKEVLKWTGDGKSSADIAEILLLSENTVNFHIKNAVSKLNVANKTAAVVRAMMMGLLE